MASQGFFFDFYHWAAVYKVPTGFVSSLHYIDSLNHPQGTSVLSFNPITGILLNMPHDIINFKLYQID